MPIQVFNPVVMAGGVGSRLWPLSRAAYPKQYQELVQDGSGQTMLQQTFERLLGLELGVSQLVCNQDHRFLAAEQMRNADLGTQIILEPMGRNTGPAVIVAALRLQKQQQDEPMLVLSADHAIADVNAFQDALKKAHTLALNDLIVTLGIEPTFACTGYGYIKCGQKTGQGYVVDAFVEKPNLATAKGYYESGRYLWNSGIFIAKPSVLIQQAQQYCEELLFQCKKVVEHVTHDLDFIRLPATEFAVCQDISLDYAIMEHTKHAAVVPVTCGWSDVGDIQALWHANKKDADGNAVTGDHVLIDTHNCLISSQSRLVATLGVENLAIIETKDAVLVANLAQSQHVKELVRLLKGRDELAFQREVFRPWGSFDSVDSGDNYQVKRISVNPGAKLSLQRHQHRAEHWVVVSGFATVHLDGNEHTLKANDSIYIPVGAVHSLANNTKDPLQLVEVQSGSYLGEDDIERLEDLYGRD